MQLHTRPSIIARLRTLLIALALLLTPLLSLASATSVLAASPGTLIGWGSANAGQLNGLGGLSAISAGGTHNLGLKSDGTVVAWGFNGPELNVPAGLSDVTAVSAGFGYSLALKSDGAVVAWGDNSEGQLNIPADAQGNLVAISAGFYHGLGLKSDGKVVGWGDNDYGQINIPDGLSGVVAVSGGGLHSLALKSDGTVVPWGDPGYGQSNIPADAQGSITAIAGGIDVDSRPKLLPDDRSPGDDIHAAPIVFPHARARRVCLVHGHHGNG